MLGNINIYFGKIVDINDPLKLLRCRVSINGLTDEIPTDSLPWYFPWYGINYLPQVGDIVPVIIFDNTLQSGMYNKSLNDKVGYDDLSQEDYNNMLELYQRDGVKLSYTPSKGIELINDDSAVNIDKQKIDLFCGTQSISVTNDNIKIGTNAKQYNLMGDEVISLLKDICDILGEVVKQFLPTNPTMAMFQAACGIPYTASLLPYATALGVQMQLIHTSLAGVKMSIDPEILQSKVTLVE